MCTGQCTGAGEHRIGFLVCMYEQCALIVLFMSFVNRACAARAPDLSCDRSASTGQSADGG
jgi:hypothetical protein